VSRILILHRVFLHGAAFRVMHYICSCKTSWLFTHYSVEAWMSIVKVGWIQIIIEMTM